MIRWKAFIPTAIIAAACIVVYLFFADSVIKGILIKTGESIFNAQVEIRTVRISLKDSSLHINGLSVANEEDPWTNLFEAESIIIDVETLPLFSKKIIVDQVSAEGVSWGTKRSTSGALRVRKKKKSEKKDDDKPRSKSIQLPLDKIKALGKKADIKKLIDVDNLESVKQARNIQVQIDEKQEKWKKNAAQFEGYTGSFKTIDQNIEAVKSIKKIETLEDIAQAKKMIQTLKESAKDLKRMKNEIASARKDLGKEVQFLKKNIAMLDSIKKQDYQELYGKLGFGNVGVSRIGNSLFGPIIMSRINTAIRWTDKIRSRLPKKKGKGAKVPERKRLKGRDILFPKKKGLPALLVKKISFSARGPENQDTKQLVVTVTITHITSNPVLLGKPVTITGAGSFASMSGSDVSFKGILDYTTDVSQEKFNIEMNGIDCAGIQWSGGTYVPSGLTGGTGALAMELVRRGNTIECAVDARAQDVTFAPIGGNNKADRSVQVMNDIFTGIDTVQVTGTISGTLPADLDVSLSSNLDQIISKQLKDLFGREIDKQKALVRKEVDAIVAAEKKKLLGEVNARQKEIKEKLLGTENGIGKKLDLVQQYTDDKESFIKSFTEKKKKEGTKKIQKNLEDTFKKLFK